ncbi:MAG: RNA-binding protein [Flavipsychrobacter sp.]|nr:RNA-binding protein [Flavipsychrobacter sp.]
MNLYVGNLNPETSVNNLRPLFAEFGEVVSAKIIFDNATGMSRGFGFVEMADKFHAMDAIDNLDATFFEGNIISVKEAKANTGGKSSPGGRSAGPNRSFRPRTPRTDYNRGNDYNRSNGDYNSNRNTDYNRY